MGGHGYRIGNISCWCKRKKRRVRNHKRWKITKRKRYRRVTQRNVEEGRVSSHTCSLRPHFNHLSNVVLSLGASALCGSYVQVVICSMPEQAQTFIVLLHFMCMISVS